MRLPATLAPWRQWLDWFDPEPAAALGELLLRLHPLLGAFRLRATGGAVEPEGIDDLRRRGSYERLLLSEWALAEAAPDEFDRRAAGGEHLFLSPKLVARQSDALTVAVFDSGPAQFGAPRLLHIALWILLAQRAQAAKARFGWGVLGAPGQLHEADSAQHLVELLRARAWQPGAAPAPQAAPAAPRAGRAELERQWAQWLDAQQPSPGERWSIGAPAAGYGLGHRVGIARGDADGLRIAVAAPRARREMNLPLPPAKTAQLLHGRFLAAAVAAEPEDNVTVVRVPRRISLKQPPLLAADGGSVAVALLGEHAVHLQRLTQKRRHSPPALVRWGASRDLLAATVANHRFGGVASAPHSLVFWALPGFSSASRPAEFKSVPEQGRWLPLLRVETRPSEPPSRESAELLMLARGTLWRWPSRARAARGETGQAIAEGVLAIAPVAAAWIEYLRVRAGRVEVCHTRPGEAGQALVRAECAGDPLSGWLYTHSGRRRRAAAVQFAIGGHGGERATMWRLLQWMDENTLENFELILPSEWKAIGVDSPPGGDVALIALNPDRTEVLALGERQRRVLYRSRTRLTVGSVAGGGETVALIDLQGRLVVLHDRGASTTIYAGEGSDD